MTSHATVMHFLESYRTAFERGDPREIVAHYHVPTASISAKEVVVFRAAEALDEIFTAVTAKFRAQGLARCVYHLQELRCHAQGLVELALHWRVLRQDETLITTISLRYILLPVAGTFKIGTVVLFDE